MEAEDLVYKIAFARLKGNNRSMASDLLSRSETPERFFSFKASQLSALYGRRLPLFDDNARACAIEDAKREYSFVKAHGIKPYFFADADYPKRMLECEDAPLMLYTMGDCDLDSPCMVSIVGTRHATPYGIRFVQRLVEEMAQKLVTPPVIVSGLAHGIDVAAHNAAIANGLKTVAVLGHGLKTIYPAANRSVAARIVKDSGALVTEYASDAQICRGFFLARNRIIAGLCDYTVIAESAIRGGAMATARLAQNYSRDVYALPGRVGDPYSEGCNRLIATNVAGLIESTDAFIENTGWPCKLQEGEQAQLPVITDPNDQRIIDYLTERGDSQLNQMSVDLDIPVSRLTASLIDLEFKGYVLPYPGGFYRAIRL